MNRAVYPHEFPKVILALEERLKANYSQKDNSWQTCDNMFLRMKLVEEFAEVILDPYNSAELADLANITLMLLWRYSK